MLTESNAVWVMEKGQPLVIKPRPYTPPRADEITIKAAAFAVNPVDAYMQMQNLAVAFPLPTIPGVDVAGTVEEVGSAVTRFKKGDRVVGGAFGSMFQDPTMGGFQEYVLTKEFFASAIPDSLPEEQACVFPCTSYTAAVALFMDGWLELQHPVNNPQPVDKTVFIWGGASSVGCNTIQFAHAAGYDVVATASPKNAAMLKSLGASAVFDYNNPDVVDEVVKALQGKTLVGAVQATGMEDVPKTSEILRRSNGRKFIASAQPVQAPDGIEAKFIMPPDFLTCPINNLLFADFLPHALTNGIVKPAPEPEVFGKGLQAFEGAMDRVRKGVSARKIVVTL